MCVCVYVCVCVCVCVWVHMCMSVCREIFVREILLCLKNKYLNNHIDVTNFGMNISWRSVAFFQKKSKITYNKNMFYCLRQPNRNDAKWVNGDLYVKNCLSYDVSAMFLNYMKFSKKLTYLKTCSLAVEINMPEWKRVNFDIVYSALSCGSKVNIKRGLLETKIHSTEGETGFYLSLSVEKYN